MYGYYRHDLRDCHLRCLRQTVDSSPIVVCLSSRSECSSCAQPTLRVRTDRYIQRDVPTIPIELSRHRFCFTPTVLQDCCLVWTGSYILVFCSRQEHWAPIMPTALNNTVLFFFILQRQSERETYFTYLRFLAVMLHIL